MRDHASPVPAVHPRISNAAVLSLEWKWLVAFDFVVSLGTFSSSSSSSSSSFFLGEDFHGTRDTTTRGPTTIDCSRHRLSAKRVQRQLASPADLYIRKNLRNGGHLDADFLGFEGRVRLIG